MHSVFDPRSIRIKFYYSDYGKLLKKIHHLLSRIDRILMSESDELNKRGELITEIFRLRQKLNT